jgi:hypothetical protein
MPRRGDQPLGQEGATERDPEAEDLGNVAMTVPRFALRQASARRPNR